MFHWLNEQNHTFYFLQETHVTQAKYDIWESEWGFKAYFSGNSSNSEGLAILVNKQFAFNNITRHIDILPGKLQALEINIENREIVMVNIYGPNIDNPFVFEKLDSFLSDHANKHIIIAGDFNTILDIDLDKKRRKAKYTQNMQKTYFRHYPKQ